MLNPELNGFNAIVQNVINEAKIDTIKSQSALLYPKFE
jgi:hypothetical protein